MNKQDLIHKIEWANKRSSLKGEPFTPSQIELLMFVFEDVVSNKKSDLVNIKTQNNDLTNEIKNHDE